MLIGAIPPFLLKTDDNPEGVDRSVFDGIKAAVIADRPAYFKDFLDNFYNVDVLGGTRISDQAWQDSFIVAVAASAYAARLRRHLADRLPRRPAEDRRPDAARPRRRGPDPALRGHRRAAARPDQGPEFVTVEGGPHNIAWTHPDEVNKALLEFVGGSVVEAGSVSSVAA